MNIARLGNLKIKGLGVFGFVIDKRAQGLGHVGGPLKAQASVFGRHSINDSCEVRGNIRPRLGQRLWHQFTMGFEFLDKASSGNG